MNRMPRLLFPRRPKRKSRSLYCALLLVVIISSSITLTWRTQPVLVHNPVTGETELSQQQSTILTRNPAVNVKQNGNSIATPKLQQIQSVNTAQPTKSSIQIISGDNSPAGESKSELIRFSQDDKLRRPYYHVENLQANQLNTVTISDQVHRCQSASYKPGFIWVRNQKTASTSLYKFLDQLRHKHHMIGSNVTHVGQGCKRLSFRFDYHPEDLRMHVPYYGCIEQGMSNPIRLVTLRNPIERALSVFYHGHTHGPLEKRNLHCKQLAKKKDLVGYLTSCKDTIKNYYVNMLAPETQSLQVALNRLQTFNVMILEDLDTSFEIVKAVMCVKQETSSKVLRKVNINQNRESRIKEPLPLDGVQMLYEFVANDMIVYEEGLRLYHMQKQEFERINETL